LRNADEVVRAIDDKRVPTMPGAQTRRAINWRQRPTRKQ